MLLALRKSLKELELKVKQLNKDLIRNQDEKEKFESESKALQKKHDNANLLVSGLSSSKVRWERDVAVFDEHYGLLAGNVLLSAAFFSYLGPFPSEYRDEII